MASAERLHFTARRHPARPASSAEAAQNVHYVGVPLNEDHEDRRHFSAPPALRRAAANNANSTPSQPLVQELYGGHSTQHGDEPVKPYEASNKPWRLAAGTLLMALLALGMIVIPIGVLFGYMFFWHSTTRVGNNLETGADPTNLLGIIGFITKATEQGTVIVMGLMATSAASKWWRATHSHHQDERPTGVQLGLAMDVMNSANIWAAFDGIAFTFGLKNDKPHRSIRLPSYVRNAVFLLVWLLTLHFTIAGLDYALHFSSGPTDVIEKSFRSVNASGLWHDLNLNISSVLPRKSTVDGFELPLGRIFNDARSSCGLQNGSNNEQYINTPDAHRTLTNTSDKTAVAWTHNGTAIMVPGSQVNISYTARSIAAQTQCMSITNRCVQCHYDATNDINTCQTTPSSPFVYLNFNCPNLNTTVDFEGKYPVGVIDPATNRVLSDSPTGPATDANWSWPAPQTNPFRFAFVAEAETYIGTGNSSSGSFAGDTGFITWGHVGDLNVVDCNVTILDAVYSFVPPSTYKLISSEKLPMNQTKFVAFAGYSGYDITSQAITMPIEGAGIVNDSMAFHNAAALQISKQFVAWSSVLVDNQATISIDGFKVAGTRLSANVLGAYLAVTLLYLLTTVFVSLNAIISTLLCKSPAQSLVQGRLLKPYAVLADTYGRRTTDARHSLTRSGFRMFDPQHDADRLDVVEAYDQTNRVWRVNAVRTGCEIPVDHALQNRESEDK